MNRKRFGLSGVLVLLAVLALGAGYAQAQTPGQIPVFIDPAGDLADSVVTQDASGRIGIGTTNPAFGSLQISQSGPAPALTIDGSNFPPNNYHLDLVAFSPDSGIVNYKFVTKREDQGLSTDVLTLTQPTIPFGEGKVGIGTNAPTAKLHVVGDFLATGNVVSGGHISVGGSRALGCTRSCGPIASVPSGGVSTYSSGAVASPAGYSLTGCSAYWASSAACTMIQYPSASNITPLDDGAGACHSLGYNGSGSTLESCACVTACQLP